MTIDLIIYILWTISCVLAFLGGVALKNLNSHRKKLDNFALPHSADTDKQLKELQNFWAYDGTEQEPILDEESF
jgi:hypothetical protein